MALRFGGGLGATNTAADMNRNGSVSASDALDILRIAVAVIRDKATCNG